MCGRYYIDEETSIEIKKIVQDIQNQKSKSTMKTGEIYPSENVPILVGKSDDMVPKVITWGAPGFNKGSRIINARSETVFDKKMFKDSIIHRRCIIPANGFYEWNRLGDKKKYYFTDLDNDTIYMAGIYNRFEDMDCFMILTTNANSCMSDIHNRMPLILKKEQTKDWLMDEGQTKHFLNMIPYNLRREASKELKQNEYEQMTFDSFYKNNL